MSGRHGTAVRRGGSFDAFDVVSRRASFAGKADAAALPRVADRLDRDSGAAEVSWRITGCLDAAGRPALEVSLDGAVPLVCQRCLRPFAWPVAQRTLLLLARDERELARLDAEDEHEVLLAAAPVDTKTLVEDELLLTLPFVPRCERIECAQAATTAAFGPDADAPAAAFAALAALKPGPAKKGDE